MNMSKRGATVTAAMVRRACREYSRRHYECVTAIPPHPLPHVEAMRAAIEAGLSHSSAEKRDNPITVTDAMVEEFIESIAKTCGTVRMGDGIPIQYIGSAIEAALSVRSEE
jgi:hypothetical protein